MSHRIEYRNDALDRSRWPRGEWDFEPDKVSWIDDATGLDCVIVRNHLGALCGYVGLPPGHLMHGRDFDSVRASDGEWPSCHGGLTFAGPCSKGDDPAQGICHVPLPGRPDDVWWVGFDCAHAGDSVPGLLGYLSANSWLQGQYRNVRWVEREVTRLAAEMSCHLEEGR